ncbi:MAG: DUF2834 domain-containing protein [Deltaproteobacteria bacterium]|jgi:hypothetical protein|nr:DUF2834 domain-containing protein [Deltaproteobacteria bacterium]
MAFFYLGLAFLGAVAPYSFLGQFLVSSGLNFAEIRAQMWASPVSGYFSLNALIAGLVTILFIWSEGRRQKMKGLWLPLVATLLVGVACGLPLFLYLRRVTMERMTTNAPVESPTTPSKVTK